MELSKADKYALSQEANSRLCYCQFEDEMMGKVPEGSFCPFCGWRRYESVIVKTTQLEEIKAAAQIIYDVSSKASLKADAIECPHGNIPAYPSHAWWCDKCFYRLEDALGDE